MPDAGHNYFAYVGCRTSRERNAHGDGISVWRPTQDGWQPIQTVDKLLNPSYLAFDRTQDFLYAVHGDSTDISAFRIDRHTGKLTFLNKVPTGGANPVHLTLDPANRFIVIANHIVRGDKVPNISVIARNPDGTLGAMTDLVKLNGKIGPHRVEQPFPKPHQVAYDPAEKFIIVPDKGCDLVRSYSLSQDGKLTQVVTPAVAREEAGPRHVSFHPTRPFAYVVNELDSTLTAYQYDAATGALTAFQILSSLPDSFTGNSRASEIAISGDGRFVYASNRGSDSIGVFAADPQTGRLTALGWQPCGGKTPRFHAISPFDDSILVTNEESDSITRMPIDPKSGLVGEAKVVVQTGSPTCLLFLKAR
jgi:6-phosphogluconolactonase (cycloisomerase 2 family)